MGTTQETEAPVDEPAAPRASTEVGQRIAAILDAAEASAEKIRTGARAEASEILHQAHERAAARMEELTLEPERIRDEAARQADETRAAAEAFSVETRAAADGYASETRAAADGYSAETRAEADAYSAETRRAAEGDARQLRQDAESDVRKIEEEGRRREKELADQTRQLAVVRDEAVAKVRAAIGGMRDAADLLETETLPAAGIVPQPPHPEARGLARLLRRGTVAPTNGTAPADASPADDLYARAKGLGIRGRSKMTRDELEQAVRAASVPGDDADGS